MTMHGGDYRKAGQRGEGSHLTLAMLRKLLEDDVKNLERMTSTSNTNTSTSTNTNTSTDTDTNVRGVSLDIQDSELNLIMNRSLLFPKCPNSLTGYGPSEIPAEGTMYDVVETTVHANALQSVKY
jgi:hypothetical protein